MLVCLQQLTCDKHVQPKQMQTMRGMGDHVLACGWSIEEHFA